MDLFELPKDVLEEVFAFLSVKDVLMLEQSCCDGRKQGQLFWRQISTLNLVPFLRLHLGDEIISKAYRFDLAGSCLIKRIGPYLKALELSKFGSLEYGLRFGLETSLLLHCSRLSHLEMNNRLLDREWLVNLAKATGPTMRRLSLNQIYIRGVGHLCDERLTIFLKFWTRLEALRIRNNRNVRLSCYTSLPITLKFLDVQGCWICTKYLPKLMSRCPMLQSLLITYNADFITLPPETFTSLTKLDLEYMDFTYLEGKTALLIAPPHSKLKSLTINSSLWTDELFELIFSNLTELEELSIPGQKVSLYVTQPLVSFATLGVKLRKLKKLSAVGNQWAIAILEVLSNFVALQELDVSYSIRGSELISMMPEIGSSTLKSITMRGLQAGNLRVMFTEDIVKRLSSQCPQLKRVILHPEPKDPTTVAPWLITYQSEIQSTSFSTYRWEMVRKCMADHLQPFGRYLFHGLTSAHPPFLSRTVMVKDNNVEEGMRSLNRLMARENLLFIIRNTMRFEKPYLQRSRFSYERSRAIYDEDMNRKINFLMKKNRKDPLPGMY